MVGYGISWGFIGGQNELNHLLPPLTPSLFLPIRNTIPNLMGVYPSLFESGRANILFFYILINSYFAMASPCCSERKNLLTEIMRFRSNSMMSWREPRRTLKIFDYFRNGFALFISFWEAGTATDSVSLYSAIAIVSCRFTRMVSCFVCLLVFKDFFVCLLVFKDFFVCLLVFKDFFVCLLVFKDFFVFRGMKEIKRGNHILQEIEPWRMLPVALEVGILQSYIFLISPRNESRWEIWV